MSPLLLLGVIWLQLRMVDWALAIDCSSRSVENGTEVELSAWCLSGGVVEYVWEPAAHIQASSIDHPTICYSCVGADQTCLEHKDSDDGSTQTVTLATSMASCVFTGCYVYDNAEQTYPTRAIPPVTCTGVVETSSLSHSSTSGRTSYTLWSSHGSLLSTSASTLSKTSTSTTSITSTPTSMTSVLISMTSVPTSPTTIVPTSPTTSVPTSQTRLASSPTLIPGGSPAELFVAVSVVAGLMVAVVITLTMVIVVYRRRPTGMYRFREKINNGITAKGFDPSIEMPVSIQIHNFPFQPMEQMDTQSVHDQLFEEPQGYVRSEGFTTTVGILPPAEMGPEGDFQDGPSTGSIMELCDEMRPERQDFRRSMLSPTRSDQSGYIFDHDWPTL